MALLWPLHTLLPEWQPCKAIQRKSMQGKVVIVTGGNAGIGFEACLNLAKAGAHVIVAARNHQRGTAAVAHITQQVPHASVEFAQVDMSSVASIIAFSEWFYQKHKGLLHVLIQNAGVFLQPASITADGLELTMATNVLGPHLLLTLLTDALAAAGGGARVVFVASSSEQVGSLAALDDPTYVRGTSVHQPDLLRYGTTKLWTLMCIPEWQQRLGPRGVDVFACHPGLSKSSLFTKYTPTDAVGWLFALWEATIAQPQRHGALSMLYCAMEPTLAGKGGSYYGPFYTWCWNPGLSVGNTWHPIRPVHPATRDPALCQRAFAVIDALMTQQYMGHTERKVDGRAEENVLSKEL